MAEFATMNRHIDTHDDTMIPLLYYPVHGGGAVQFLKFVSDIHQDACGCAAVCVIIGVSAEVWGWGLWGTFPQFP